MYPSDAITLNGQVSLPAGSVTFYDLIATSTYTVLQATMQSSSKLVASGDIISCSNATTTAVASFPNLATTTILWNYGANLTESRANSSFLCINQPLRIIVPSGSTHTVFYSVTYVPRVMASSSPMSTDAIMTSFGLAIIIGILFLFVVAYVYNQFKPKKPWLRS